tara:strand:- start:89 stop:418 length:330 start_codon:yes stop_codon:yes gene_type:complete
MQQWISALNSLVLYCAAPSLAEQAEGTSVPPQQSSTIHSAQLRPLRATAPSTSVSMSLHSSGGGDEGGDSPSGAPRHDGTEMVSPKTRKRDLPMTALVNHRSKVECVVM